MKRGKKLLAVVAAFLLASCGAPKQIAYFQDSDEGGINVAAPNEIKIQPKDELSIIVNSQDPRLTNLFNLPIISQQIGVEGSAVNRGLSAYTVDSDGNIDFPALGKLRVQGMTREEVAALIKEKLVSEDWVRDPVVTVKFINLSVSVMGEVTRPGRYNIDKDNFTLLDAISLAGDLTIYGKREKVMVMRNENGAQQVYNVDLCSAKNLYESPAFYLRQNDVVYVEPNNTRKRQSTVNGNNVRSTSFWISFTSLLTTIAVLIFR